MYAPVQESREKVSAFVSVEAWWRGSETEGAISLCRANGVTRSICAVGVAFDGCIQLQTIVLRSSHNVSQSSKVSQ